MKLIPTLEISKGISMDTLKPILNSGAESSFETCLGVKETPDDDNLLHPDKRPQKSLQKDKGLPDKSVESVGSNAKKMFEKVDLNSSLSSDVSLKKDSWSTGTVYSNCSEKENMVENSEMRFDILSDDENESLHLKISDDEESSTDDLAQSISYDHSKSNNFVGSDDSKSNEHSDPGRDVLGSRDDDLNCKELTSSESIDVEVLPEDKEPSKADTSLTPVSESDHVSSTEDLENLQSCSKVVQPVPGYNSTYTDAIGDVGMVEEDAGIEKNDTDVDEGQSTCSYVKDSEDEISKKLVDHSDNTSGKLLVTNDIRKEECDTKKRNLGGELKSSMQHDLSLNDEESDTCEQDKFLKSDKKAKSTIEDVNHLSATKDLRAKEEFQPRNKEPREPLEFMDFTDEITSNEFCDDVDILDSNDEANEKLLLDELDPSKSEEGIPIGDEQIDEHTENLLLDSGSEDNHCPQLRNFNSFSERTDHLTNGNSSLSDSERVSENSVCTKKEDTRDELESLDSVSNSKVLIKDRDLIDEKEGCALSKVKDLIDQKEGCVISESEDLGDQKEGSVLIQSEDSGDEKEGSVLIQSEDLGDQREESVLIQSEDLVDQKEGCVLSRKRVLKECDLSKNKAVIDQKDHDICKSKDLVDQKVGSVVSKNSDLVDQKDSDLCKSKHLVYQIEGSVESKNSDLVDQKDSDLCKSKDLVENEGSVVSKNSDLVDQKDSDLCKSNDLVDKNEGSVASKNSDLVDQKEGSVVSKNSDLVDQKEVLSESKDVIDNKEGCVLSKCEDFIGKEGCESKVCSETSSSRKKELLLSHDEVLGRKRTSPSSDEKIVISSKRSKVDKEDCDGPLLKISTSGYKEVMAKKAKIENDSNKQELKLTKQELDKEKLDKQELNTPELCEQELNEGELGNSQAVVENKSSNLNLCTEDDKMDVSEEETSQELKSDDKADSKSNSKDSDKKLNPLPLLRNFNRAQLKTMTRNDLEELVLQKICEAITERSMCGELRELAVNLDQKLKSWQKKSLQLTKQVKDLSLVLKRYGSDLQSKGPNATPLKITRSVGLQVQMPGSSTGICWHPDDQSWKKGEKAAAEKAVAVAAAASNSSVKSVVPNALPKSTPPPSPAAKVTPNSPVSQKVTERVSASPAAPQNTQTPTAVIKVLPVKPPVPASPIATNKASQKTTIPSVTRLKPSSDLQVIDLTDNEEKSKSSTNQTPSTSVSTDVTTALVPSITSSAVTRSIRVVQHLTSTSSSLIPQTVTTPVAGRLAYYVPTTTVQQRQLIISNPPVRPSGVVVSNRQNTLPAIVLNSKNIVPMTAVPASNANIIRASNISNAIQLGTSRTPPRTHHFLQRLPIAATSVSTTGVLGSSVSIHPAPLPAVPLSGPSNPNWKLPPPKPDLKISKVPNRNQQGIVLSWNMTISSEYEEIASYQLFAYQEAAAPPSTHLWKKVGDVKALPLPMACTLTQFMEGHKYHFAVRAVDVYARYGPFSTPGNIVLTRN